MTTVRCRSLGEYQEYLERETTREQLRFEHRLAERHNHLKLFRMPGRCTVDGSEVEFLVDRKWGAQTGADGICIPNWRERLECPLCGLNCRQRAVTERLLEFAERRTRSVGSSATLYLMEQVTPLFRHLRSRFGPSCVGSEFLGPDRPPGEISEDGIRHEDAEALSFDDGSFDAVISNDVLEHVNEPGLAVAEVARVLRSGGRFWFTIPFYADREESERRARYTADGPVHSLPPQYHGDPLSPEGSLVVTDFGWEFVRTVGAAGFADCWGETYWAAESGFLGSGGLLFCAVKAASDPQPSADPSQASRNR